MTDSAPSTPLRYGVALAALALATAARFALDPALGDHLPYVTYFVAIMAVARYGGLGPSLATLALGSLASTYFFVPPRGGLVPHRLSDSVGIGLYFFVGLSSALLCEALRDARRRAEAHAAQAAENGERLRVTLVSIGDAVIATDPLGRIGFMNPVAEALTGWRAGEAAGRPLGEVFRIVHEEDRRPVESPVVRVLREGSVVGLANHVLLIARDGAERPIADSAAPIRDAGGHLVGVVLVFRDVTERRRMEVALDESEDHYRHAVELSPQLLWTADPEGRMTGFSDRWLDLTGLTREEALGDGWMRLPHPDDLPRMVEAWAHCVRTGEPYDIEHRTRLATGDYRWMRSRAYPRRDVKGAVVRWYGTTEDITERKAAEEAIRRQARITGAITENATTAIFLMDAEGRTTSMNPAAEAMTGYPLREAEGRVLHELVHHLRPDGSPFPMDHCPIGRHVLAQRELRGHEDEFVRRDGTFFPVRCAARPIIECGSLTGIVLEVQDITEERRAGQRVRESEGRFRSLMEQAPFSVQVFDPEGRTVAVNRAWEELWGITLDQIADYNVLHDPQLEAKGVLPHLRRAFAGEPAQIPAIRYDPNETIPDRTRHADPRRWVSAVAYPLRDAAGRVREVVLVHDDITERVRAEEAQRQSEERLRLIVESASDYAIFTLDLDGKVTTWNSGARNLLGYEEQEIVGEDGKILFIPEDIERGVPEQEFQKALERGRAENERWHLRKDGTRFWASGLLMPMRDGGEAVGLLKIMRDTTEQKRTEQELEVSRERLDLVVNSSEVGLWYCDLPFATLVWNAKCKEHFGLPADAEVTIDTFYGRIHPEDREATRRAIERSIEGRSEYDAEFRTVDGQGRVRWVRAIGQPFYDVEGTPLRFDGITVDVTQRIRQEEALREADRRKNDFLAMLAHELRNPLAPIRNAVAVLGGGEPPDPVTLGWACSMMGRQVDHLVRLVDDLLDVSRIMRGKVALQAELVDLAAVVARSVETSTPVVAEHGHELTINLPPEPLPVEADAFRLAQVFSNLLNNAAKYTERGGHIRLDARREDGQVFVSVRDDGVGIPPEELPHVFGLFT
jgi:PAS domain S-box-containing protein